MRIWATLLAVLISGCSTNPPHGGAVSLCVGDGGDCFPTIQAAVDSLSNVERRVEIHIASGCYYEKLVVTQPNIHFIGDANSPSTIYHGTFAGQPMPGSDETYGTWRSATVTIRSQDVSFKHINIFNTYDYPSNDALDKNDPAKQRGSQAVALMLDKGSDRFLFQLGEIKGYQDTLFTLAGRSLFINSTISGHVDFIFGAGTALFVGNTIVTEPRAKPMQTIGYLTAPSTDIGTNYGLVFWNNKLTANSGVAPNTMGLGRPWHPTTTFPDGRYADPNAIGQSIFIANWMGEHIQTHPWHPMGGTAKEGGKTYFQPEDARFFEYASCGPGGSHSTSRRQLEYQQMTTFEPMAVLGDWHPDVDLEVTLNCPR
ncbi:Putative pectinesterase [Aequoribacter fuscus]|uniref:Putative pectinesterase n=1 Tax=Aequoribacter fuscus TaxID=2518989 RepID=F3KZ98_9GAMM|nr:Putative pectinesterase [Aequoribacter fuscus]QHJ87482.1 pectin esterase [Aequoribacter fuscus]